jgi:aspartate-semialdehyde dehydrogenase
MKIAVVGATGLVGSVMLKVLEERNFPLNELYLCASERSVGKRLLFKGEKMNVISIDDALKHSPDIAIFSAGSNVSLKYAPKFAELGCYVIDNSSAWRMHHNKRLIIPEINADLLSKDDRIIANPNCSTIQMLMVLAPLHKRFHIKRVVVSTYQAVSGTGLKAVEQLESEEKESYDIQVYPHRIHRNCLPHCAGFEANGYTTEENKLVNETHKILDSTIAVTATCVRVPVKTGHSEAVNVEFENEFSVEEIKNILSKTKGLSLVDNIQNNEYPMPVDCEGKDDVFVGRIRRDHSNENSLNLWIVSDNLRKGAATNAVQIAEFIKEKIINI